MKILIPALPILFGFILDSIIGDPYRLPHPIRAIGIFIAFLEKKIRSRFHDLRIGGIFLALIVLFVSTACPALILIVSYRINIILGIVTESILVCYMLAARCLCNESMKVCKAAENGDIEGARQAVSMIVGRDTSVLDESGIIRAAVETVAENTSDGVTAPIFYTAFFGATGAFFYKAANTMDSMIGYKNEKYADIGSFAARLDDVLNYIPSRLTAVLMIASAAMIGLDLKNAYRIWKRDRRCHASPNSAQTEAVCAGALHVRLAGDSVYFGELHKKPYIGDNDRQIESDDIRRANRLMYVSSTLMLILALVFRIVVFGGVFS